jgi:hypothetical protein
MFIIASSALTVSAQTITFPKTTSCKSQCIIKATQAWADKAAECENLSGQAQQDCAQAAEKIFDQTYKRCLKQNHCSAARSRRGR